jgi:hypothetical protein
MSFWDSVAALELRVDGYSLARRESQTPSGWTRVTTVVEMDGADAAGVGEDVTYEAESHDGVPAELMLAGTWTLEGFSDFLDGFEELAEGYRRWALKAPRSTSRYARTAWGWARRSVARSVRSALPSPPAPTPRAGSQSHRSSSSSSTPRRIGIASSCDGCVHSTASASST